MKTRLSFVVFSSVVFVLSFAYTALVNTTLNDFFLSGSQPLQSGTFTASCNCHQGYNSAVEPDFNWRGGMMSQAARDPLYYATMVIANQDAAFVGDLCLRCHTPTGWLEGRSNPTDGSALTAQDREGVHCEYCHRMIKPSAKGVNPYPSDASYRTVISGYSTPSTYGRDTTYLNTLSPRPALTGNGMFVVDSDDTRRGPRTDADPRHPLRYSPFHRDAALCGTCHDVSNPVFDKQVDGSGNYYYTLNNLNTIPASFNAYDHFPVERTYSEWLVSSYNTSQGVYAPQFGGNKQYVSTCQDCHMRDVNGKAATQGNVVSRTDLALHDQTGGNTWVPKIIPALYPGETNTAALDSGISRALYMLRNAASLQVSEQYPNIIVRVTNETGHKLPSGYPEGRRMWLNVKAFNAQMKLLAEFGAYDTATAVLTTSNTKVYEAKLGMSADVMNATGLSNDADGSSFHFALNNIVVKDNRIPPRGFSNAVFKTVQALPVGYSYPDGQYWDETTFQLPAQTVWYEVNLYYQTTSKEYIDFLKNNNQTNNLGAQLQSAWQTSGKSAPVLMEQYKPTNPLPIELASFTVAAASVNNVLLEWKTVSEVNNYGFYVQRRAEGEFDFAELPDNFIAGSGTTLEAHGYSWVDNNVSAGTYDYRLRQVDYDGSQGFSYPVRVTVLNPTEVENSEQVPSNIELSPNYPNPFNPVTVISYSVAKPGNVILEVVDAKGTVVSTPVSSYRQEGRYSETIDASGWASGVYFFRLTVMPQDRSQRNTVLTRKGVLIK